MSGLALVLVFAGPVLFAFCSRNGVEYFLGRSGGAYWDDRGYCKTHPNGQMKLYQELVSCREILTRQEYCIRHLHETAKVGSYTLMCDTFLGQEDEHDPYDAY
jgi:hypothetical protein